MKFRLRDIEEDNTCKDRLIKQLEADLECIEESLAMKEKEIDKLRVDRDYYRRYVADLEDRLNHTSRDVRERETFKDKLRISERERIKAQEDAEYLRSLAAKFEKELDYYKEGQPEEDRSQEDLNKKLVQKDELLQNLNVKFANLQKKVDIAEKELKISIRKKLNTKP